MKRYTVLDIGGTFVKAAVMDVSGEIIAKEEIPTPIQGGDDTYELIRQVVRRNMRDYPTIAGLALSIPGAVDVETGYVSFAGTVTDFIGDKVKEELADLDIPIEVENDANCVALAEKWKGNAMDADSFLCVTVGTGIGGAIYLNDGILRGLDGMAGEFGMMLLSHVEDMDDLFETKTFSRVASTWNLIYHLDNHFGITRTGNEWFALYDSGDEEVGKIIERFYYQLSLGIINLIHILAPKKILIGGGISERGDLIHYIQKQAKKVPSPIASKVIIEACKFKNQAGLIGALYHLLNRQKSL